MSSVFQRETIEFLPVEVTLDGVAVTAGVELAITAGVARPTTWAAPTSLGGRIGVLIGNGQAVGVYTVWARITDAGSPEVPVIVLGTYRIE